MVRLFKWIFLCVVLPLALLLAAAIAVFKLVPQDTFRAVLAEKLGARMNRQMVIGPIQLGLLGLEIEELKFSEIPTFQAGTFLTAKGVHLGWDPRALWEGLDVKKRFITQSAGRFHVDTIENPHYIGQNFLLTWSLTDMDPTWSHVNGWAHVEQGAGLLQNINELAAASPSTKLALTPVTLLMNLERAGFLNLGLPNLQHWPIQKIDGDYFFKEGVMKIQHFEVQSAQLNMETNGAVEIASGKLALDIELKSPPRTVMGALDAKLRVTGTVSHPKLDVESLKKKGFKATITNLLQQPNAASQDVNDAIKKLFR